VTCFRVRSDYLARHPLQTAGARMHQEYWIPAEEMDDFNRAIVSTIEVVAEFHGKGGG
jgi:hypothetical protein